MNLPTACAIISAVPIVVESNHSAASALHPHRTDAQTTTTYNAPRFLAD